MARQINSTGLDEIKLSEGCKLAAYRDGGDVPTIGYGHTLGVRIGMTCTEEQATAWLLEDIATAERAVERLVQVPLTDDEFAALVDFVFNVGVEAFAASTLLRVLNQGDYEAVPAQLHRWTHDARGRVEPGLVTRRTREAALWEAGAAAAGYAPSRMDANVKPVSYLSAENVAAATPVVAALAGAASSPGPLQWAVAAAVAVGCIAAVVLFILKQAR